MVAVFENKFNLGKVSRIECIPKVSTQDGHEYYSAYVYFDTWTSSPSALYLQSQFAEGASTKMFYWDKTYWVVCLNTSPLQQTVDKQPEHWSLVTYLPADISAETCEKVMQALDLGEINCIDYDAITTTGDNYYEQDAIWSMMNEKGKKEIESLPTRKIVIHFNYWYRTQSATSFQYWMRLQSYVDIPFLNMTWTFYSSNPITSGINPHVWTRPIPSMLPLERHPHWHDIEAAQEEQFWNAIRQEQDIESAVHDTHEEEQFWKNIASSV